MREATRSRPPARGRRPAPRTRRRARWRLPFGPGGRVAAALLGLLIVVLGVGAALGAARDDGDAPAGVEVEGVNVSGLSPDEVERAVRYRARQLMAQPVVIVRDDAPERPIKVARVEPRRPAPDRARGRRGARAAQPGRQDPRRPRGRADARGRHRLHRPPGAGERRGRPRRRRPRRPAGARAPARHQGRHRRRARQGRLRHRRVRAARPHRGDAARSRSTWPWGSSRRRSRRRRPTAARELALRVVRPPGRGLAPGPRRRRSSRRCCARPSASRPTRRSCSVRLDPDTLYREIASAYSTREQPARDAVLEAERGDGHAGALARGAQPRHGGDRARRSSPPRAPPRCARASR